jgi:DNA relaxase NicK
MLTWWAEFLEYVAYQRCQVECKKPVTTIESRVSWVNKQVAKTLALLEKTFGVDKFNELLYQWKESGKRRLRQAENNLIKEYLNVQLA